jgi:predicted porin
VTLSGTFDLSLQNAKNDATSATTMAKNGMASSRIQFAGTEDLGGGMTANFLCDTTLTPDAGAGYTAGAAGTAGGSTTGTNTAATATASLCDRIGLVGVAGGFGRVDLGGDYTPMFRVTGIADPFGTNGVAGWYNLGGSIARGQLVTGDVSTTTTIFATGTSASLAYPAFAGTGTGGAKDYKSVASVNATRANRSVTYTSPTFNGVSAAVMYIVDGIAGNATTGKLGAGYSARVRYDAGPLTVAVGAQTVKHASNGTATSAGTAVSDLDTTILGASYDLGVAKVTFGYQTQKFLGLKATDTIVGLIVPMGAGTIKASYANKSVDTADNTGAFGAKQLGLGYIHSLSKRTDLYAQYGRITNGADSQYGMLTPTAGRSSNAYQVGVRHAF